MANGAVDTKIHKDLLLACGWGKEIDVILLFQQGASVKVQDQDARNCLHYASSKGHTHIVKILLEKKCNVNARDKFEATPLHHAAINGHAETAVALLEGRANVNSQDEHENTALHEAINGGNADVVEVLLDYDADLNLHNKTGFTPLQLATVNNHSDIIDALCKAGANINSQSNNGNTALQIAILNKHLESVETLLKFGGDINHQNYDGNSALHLCAELGLPDFAKSLLNCGQPYEARENNVGDTAKDVAIHHGHRDIAEIIPAREVKLHRHQKKSEKNTDDPTVKSKRHEHRRSKKKFTGKDKDKPITVSIERPSADNLLYTDSLTCSSLSSLWIPAPTSGTNLPMDVYWHPNNITLTRQEDLDVTPTTAIDELRRYDRKWHSDASSGISGGSEPRYPVRRRRRRRKPYQGNLGRLETVNEGEDGIEDEEIKVEPIREIKGKRELKAKKAKRSKHFTSKKANVKKLDKLTTDTRSDPRGGQRSKKKKHKKSKRHPLDEPDAEKIQSPRVKGRAELRQEEQDKLLLQAFLKDDKGALNNTWPMVYYRVSPTNAQETFPPRKQFAVNKKGCKADISGKTKIDNGKTHFDKEEDKVDCACATKLDELETGQIVLQADLTVTKHGFHRKVSKLKKKFKQLLTITDKKLDDQKESQEKYFSDLKNDISFVHNSLERTAKEGQIEIVDSVKKEVNNTMEKWTKRIEICKHDGASESSGVDVVHSDRQSERRASEGGAFESVKTERVCRSWEPTRKFPSTKESRDAPQGRSDESSPSASGRLPGDGDHMADQRWYQDHVKEVEDHWKRKLANEQAALRARIQQLEEALYEHTGVLNTLV